MRPINAPLIALLLLAGQAYGAEKPEENPLRDAYFGNLHVHTSWSFDGYINGSITGPDEAAAPSTSRSATCLQRCGSAGVKPSLAASTA